jgi:hypothetical protein
MRKGLPMRDPVVNAAAAAEAKRVNDAIEIARTRLYWTLVSDRRWADSRWSGQGPKDDWEQSFRAAVEVARKIINDPACDNLLRKYAGVPGAREAIIAALQRARTRPRKKGELREQTNALRDQWIAEAVALTCRDGTFSPTRNKDAKATRDRKESGCSIVAEALRRLGLKLAEKSVADIWAEHGQAYHHLLPR